MSLRATLVGLVLGIALGAAGLSLASGWLVSGEGEAEGQIGSLSPLKVTTAKGEGSALPGQLLSLAVVVSNPNEIPLAVDSVELVDDLAVEGKDGCNASLKGLRGLQKAEDAVLKPGDTTLTFSVKLPTNLDQDCMGGTVVAHIRVTAAYGASS